MTFGGTNPTALTCPLPEHSAVSQPTNLWLTFSQRAVSRDRVRELSFTCGRKRQRRADVLTRQIWKVAQDLVLAHPPARYSRMPYTVNSLLLMHDVPLRTDGLTPIRSCQFIGRFYRPALFLATAGLDVNLSFSAEGQWSSSRWIGTPPLISTARVGDGSQLTRLTDDPAFDEPPSPTAMNIRVFNGRSSRTRTCSRSQPVSHHGSARGSCTESQASREGGPRTTNTRWHSAFSVGNAHVRCHTTVAGRVEGFALIRNSSTNQALARRFQTVHVSEPKANVYFVDLSV